MTRPLPSCGEENDESFESCWRGMGELVDTIPAEQETRRRDGDEAGLPHSILYEGALKASFSSGMLRLMRGSYFAQVENACSRHTCHTRIRRMRNVSLSTHNSEGGEERRS